MKESQLEMKKAVTVFSAAALDLWAACSTTNTERDLFRIELIQQYEATAVEGLICMVSGNVLESSAVTAAHIWPARANEDDIDETLVITSDFPTARKRTHSES